MTLILIITVRAQKSIPYPHDSTDSRYANKILTEDDMETIDSDDFRVIEIR